MRTSSAVVIFIPFSSACDAKAYGISPNPPLPPAPSLSALLSVREREAAYSELLLCSTTEKSFACLSLPYALQIFRVQCKAIGEYFIRRAYLGVEYRGELWLRTGGLGWMSALAILQACVSKCVLRGGN